MNRLANLKVPGFKFVDLDSNLCYFINEKDPPKSGSKIIKSVLETTVPGTNPLDVLVITDYVENVRSILPINCTDAELIEALTGLTHEQNPKA